LIRLQTDLVRYHPDLLVLYEGHNDLFASLRSGNGVIPATSDTPGEIPVVTPWGHWLTRHSLLYTKLVGRLQAIQFSRLRPPAAVSAAIAAMPGDSAAQSTNTAPVATPGTDKFASDLDAFLAVAKSHGLSVVVPALVHVSGSALDERDPHRRWMWANAVPFSSVPTVLRGYVTYNDILRTSAQKYDALFIPTADFGLAGAQFYAPDDPIHFNDRGADEMARHLAARLLERGALGGMKYRPLTIASGATPTP
jgi:lysophospholipase L1-like esterase